MMGGGELMKSGSSLMQQMMWSGTDSKNMMSSSSLMPCAEEEHGGVVSTKQMPPLSSSPSSMLLPQQLLQIPSSSTTTGLLAPPPDVANGTTVTSTLATRSDLQQESSMPVESWSQLLLGGLVGDHERYSAATALLSKGLNEEGPTPQQAAASYNFYGAVHGGVEIQTNKSSSHQAVSHPMLLASSPRSCITTSLGSNTLDFLTSTAPAPELKSTHQSDNSSESNSNATGSAPKKARVQTSSSAQSTLKVRKERLGDRITALHQMVSPFGKTDTASVLQETIGYIRFLLNQIEALSYPYLGHASGNADSMQQYPQILLDRNGTRAAANNDMADAGAGQAELLEQEDYSENGGEAANRKDLRSRGLCLVPVCCTSHLADDNSASDFWPVAAAPPPPPPPAPLGGMFWR